MDILLIHGMGRTPASMLLLRHRLRQRGHQASLFGYSPTVESWQGCVARLAARIRRDSASRPYALIGHSLGTVLIRGALPHLADHPPTACFFLAPPSVACRAARFFAGNPLYRLLMGEMGQKLADAEFMATLPKPAANTRIYAGTAGPTGRFSPFGAEPNDGILTVQEALGDLPVPHQSIPASHTFIMNSPTIADDIAQVLAGLE